MVCVVCGTSELCSPEVLFWLGGIRRVDGGDGGAGGCAHLLQVADAVELQAALSKRLSIYLYFCVFFKQSISILLTLIIVKLIPYLCFFLILSLYIFPFPSS